LALSDTITDAASRPEAARKRWPRSANDDSLKRFVAHYVALKKEDPAVIMERMRRIHAITGGAEDVAPSRPVAKPPRHHIKVTIVDRVREPEARPSSAPMTVWPASLRLDQAAEYCGLSVDVFKRVCPVKPIGFTESARGNRYLRASLDNWLVGLDKNAQPSSTGRKFGEKLGGQGEAQRA
jgi:hypothetical protein